MTIEEMFRRIIRAHLGLILLCTTVPLAVTVALQTREPTTWTGTVRIQVSSSAPMTSTEAEGLSSRVLALATTPRLLRGALADARIDRDVDVLAKKYVTAERLGQSSIVQLHVTDRSRLGSGEIVAALSRRVVTFMNDGNRAQFESVAEKLDEQIIEATKQRETVARALATSTDERAREDLRLALASAEQALERLNGQQATLLLSDVGRDPVIAIDPQSPSIVKDPSTLVPRGALALLLGLVFGLTLALAVETLRPKVAGVRALARILDVPVLGSSSQHAAVVVNTVAMAARRQGVDTVVLLGVDDRDNAMAAKLLSSIVDLAVQEEDIAATVKLVRSSTAGTRGGQGRAVSAVVQDEHPPSTVRSVRFTDLAGLGVTDEETVAAVVVSSGNALQSRLDSLNDVIRAMRWQVVGLVEVSRRRPSWSRK